MGDSAGLAEPPEGAIVGETVPAENAEERLDQAAIEEMVGVLKTHPAYAEYSDVELTEIAKEKLH